MYVKQFLSTFIECLQIYTGYSIIFTGFFNLAVLHTLHSFDTDIETLQTYIHAEHASLHIVEIIH